MTQSQPKQHSYVRKFRIGTAAKVVGTAAALLSLNGCLLTSPFWNQEFADHTLPIPIQAFTADKSIQVKFECATAFHGGLYPSEVSADWVLVGNVTPQSQPLLDPLGGKIYGASKSGALPAACWRKDPGNDIWYAAVRATQGSGGSLLKYRTFNKAGLECLGRENGQATSWFGWGPDCIQNYSGSTTFIPYVIFRSPV